MDGEDHSEASTQHLGEGIDERGEALTDSGWTTTKQAAKVLGVSRRSVQGYVRRGLLVAKEEGEGVTKRFIVSIDSLNALRARRSDEAAAAEDFAEPSAEAETAANLAANAGEGLRHVVDRLEARTAEATELRVRLEITERAESTLREELVDERRRREEAEAEREDLRRELQALREARESPETVVEEPEVSGPRSATGDPHSEAEGTQSPQAQESQASTLRDWSGDVQGARRPWWRRIFGS